MIGRKNLQVCNCEQLPLRGYDRTPRHNVAVCNDACSGVVVTTVAGSILEVDHAETEPHAAAGAAIGEIAKRVRHVIARKAQRGHRWGDEGLGGCGL